MQGSANVRIPDAATRSNGDVAGAVRMFAKGNGKGSDGNEPAGRFSKEYNIPPKHASDIEDKDSRVNRSAEQIADTQPWNPPGSQSLALLPRDWRSRLAARVITLRNTLELELPLARIRQLLSRLIREVDFG